MRKIACVDYVIDSPATAPQLTFGQRGGLGAGWLYRGEHASEQACHGV